MTIDHPHRRAQVFAQIAAAMAAIGDHDAAHAVIPEGIDAAHGISDPWLRDVALGDLAIAQARSDDVTGALRTLDTIGAPEVRDAVRTAVTSAHVDSDRLSAALTIARLMHMPAPRSQALRAIAVAHAEQEHMREAREIAALIPDAAVRAMAVADIAALHADIGNEQALESARLIARGVRDARQRHAALGYVAAVQAQSRDLPGALATTAAIRDAAARADALVRVADARLRIADASQVPDLLQRALTAVRQARPGEATVAVLCRIAQSFIRVRDDARARSVAESALEMTISSRRLRHNSALLAAIARIQARAGDVPGAHATADRIPADRSKALLIHDILAAQAEAGEIRQATITAQSIGDPGQRIPGLFGIVGVQTASGDRLGARDSLRLILRSVDDAQDADFRAHSLGAVAAAQVEMEDLEEGWSNFQAALAAAATLADPYARALADVNLSDPFASIARTAIKRADQEHSSIPAP